VAVTLAWGVAGTGRIARTVGAVIAAHPQMRVAAVGSRDLTRAGELARELGAATAHGSYDDLVVDPQVQAVYVATPHAQHAEVVSAALRAGRAVLSEKPMTHTPQETLRLVELARATGVFLMEGMWMRFNPLVQQLHRLVVDGELGQIRSLCASMGLASPYDPAERLWNPALGGGALLDLGVYTADLARLLLGAPETVLARGSLAPTGVDAESTLLLSWTDGAQAVLTQSLLTRLPGTATVIGTTGWAELSPTFHGPLRLSVHRGGDDAVVTEIADRAAGFVGELQEVARCLDEGRTESDTMPLADTVANARLLQDARDQFG